VLLGDEFGGVAVRGNILFPFLLAVLRWPVQRIDDAGRWRDSAIPILAAALQDAGCDNDDALTHCRAPGPHVRGCWVVDLVPGNE
jgi:hypothetical protein